MTLHDMERELRPSHAYTVGRADALRATRAAHHDCNPTTPCEKRAFALALCDLMRLTQDDARAIAYARLVLGQDDALLTDMLARSLGQFRALRHFVGLYRARHLT